MVYQLFADKLAVKYFGPVYTFKIGFESIRIDSDWFRIQFALTVHTRRIQVFYKLQRPKVEGVGESGYLSRLAYFSSIYGVSRTVLTLFFPSVDRWHVATLVQNL